MAEVDSEWDYKQLIRFGANREFVEKLTSSEAKELVKSIIYIVERQKDTDFPDETEELYQKTRRRRLSMLKKQNYAQVE